MGYESKLYIVHKPKNPVLISEELGNKFYAENIASFDLCKMGSCFDKKVDSYPATNCYIYVDGSNDKIVEDCYGKPLVEVPLADMINILQEESEISNYRRIKPALSLLKGFDLVQWDEGDLVVLRYGH